MSKRLRLALRPGLVRAVPQVVQLLGALPPRCGFVCGQLIGLLGDFLGSRMARVTDINLALCSPALPGRERRTLARRSLREDGLLVFALAAAWTGDVERLLKRVAVGPGQEEFAAAQRSGRGVLLLVPHLGNWELLNLWLQAQAGSSTPFMALYEPLRDPDLEPWLRRCRERTGARLVPADRAGIAALLRSLSAGGVVAVLPDQVPPPPAGVHAPFLGREAFTMTLVRGMVRRYRPVVLAATALREGDRYRVHFLAVDPGLAADNRRTAAMALNRTIEACIALAPEQYQWGYKRFKHQPAPHTDPYT